MGLNLNSDGCKPMVRNVRFDNYEVVEHLKMAILECSTISWLIKNLYLTMGLHPWLFKFNPIQSCVYSCNPHF
jgi:hypothetical protein